MTIGSQHCIMWSKTTFTLSKYATQLCYAIMHVLSGYFVTIVLQIVDTSCERSILLYEELMEDGLKVDTRLRSFVI